MNDKFKVPRTDVPHTDSGRAIVSLLTQKKYSYDRLSSQSKQEAIEQLRDEDSKIVDANNQRAGRKLSVREHQQMLEGKFAPDERSLIERVQTNAIIRSNTDPDDENPYRKGGLLDPKAWGNSKAGLEGLKKAEALANKWDDDRAAEQKAKSEREAREKDPSFNYAKTYATEKFRSTARNSSASEEDVAACKQRLDGLLSGKITPDQYFEIIESKEVSENTEEK